MCWKKLPVLHKNTLTYYKLYKTALNEPWLFSVEGGENLKSPGNNFFGALKEVHSCKNFIGLFSKCVMRSLLEMSLQPETFPCYIGIFSCCIRWKIRFYTEDFYPLNQVTYFTFTYIEGNIPCLLTVQCSKFVLRSALISSFYSGLLYRLILSHRTCVGSESSGLTRS